MFSMRTGVVARQARSWLLLAVVLAMTGCATLSEGQCVSGDWYEIGHRDGLRGQERSRLFNHSEACAQYGTQPDVRAYDAGRRAGLTRYCTPQQGFTEGREGRSYRGVCSLPAERDFLAAFEDGRNIHLAEERVERIERDLRRTEKQLDDEKLTTKERKRLHDELHSLRNDHRQARRDLDRVMYRHGGRNPYYR